MFPFCIFDMFHGPPPFNDDKSLHQICITLVSLQGLENLLKVDACFNGSLPSLKTDMDTQTHRIHVWYIQPTSYMMVDFYGKCREISHNGLPSLKLIFACP